MQRQTTEILKLKILQKKSIAEYLKQKNESVTWKEKKKKKTVEKPSEEQNKVKKKKELRIVSETSGTISKGRTFEL